LAARDAQIRDFVVSAGWGGARADPLAGDASNRRYLRLDRAGETAVLMDAPPETGEDVRPFIRIARHLSALGFSAPKILAHDETAGLILLEDLGDALFARISSQKTGLEKRLYSTATLLLVELHAHPPPAGLDCYDPARMTELSALAFDWYSQGITGETAQDVKDRFVEQMAPALAAHASKCDVLVQRDYHAENLLWLPERRGTARVGLLDFQDAMRGHRAYDLVSLLQDARRDVPRDIETGMLRLYVAETGVDSEEFADVYHLLGIQRNMRILGVFARLCLRDGKPHYVDLIPRVWGHLQRDLAHPALDELRRALDGALPSPETASLRRLRQKCATVAIP